MSSDNYPRPFPMFFYPRPLRPTAMVSMKSMSVRTEHFILLVSVIAHNTGWGHDLMKGQNCMIFCYAVIVMLLKLLYVEVTQIIDSDSKMWTKMAEFIRKKSCENIFFCWDLLDFCVWRIYRVNTSYLIKKGEKLLQTFIAGGMETSSISFTGRV